MVTITRTSENSPRDILIVDTVEDAEAFLGRIADGHAETPGFRTTREPHRLIVTAAGIGEPSRVLSTYTITEEN